MLQTIACADSDHLDKVPNAGEVVKRGSQSVQVMHNGIVVEEGCYYGPWMTEIIRALRGHHEPQEELAFATLVRRIREQPGQSRRTIVELGSFWAYYSLWFLNEFPDGRAICVEPDPHYLDVGRRNFALNGRVGTFIHGAVGPNPGASLRFQCESDGSQVEVPQVNLESLLTDTNTASVDVLLVDIQGAEVSLLEKTTDLLSAGVCRFAVISTHHHAISGSAVTHQTCVDLVNRAGGRVITDHSVSESCSGDGLIVASFHDEDRDLGLEVTSVRSRDSLFGELEFDCERYRLESVAARADLSRIQHETEELRAETRRLASKLETTKATAAGDRLRLSAITNSRSWRWTRFMRGS